MKVLLLGSTGLIGRQILREASAEFEFMVPNSQELNLKHDISSKLKKYRADALIFAAQDRNYSSQDVNGDDLMRINAGSLQDIQKNLKDTGIKKIIYLSSGGIYKSKTSLLNEKSAIQDYETMGPYFKSKLTAENILKGMESESDISILRLFTTYGPNANPISLMPRLESLVYERKLITIAKNEGDLLRPIHGCEVARVILADLKRNGSAIINVGGPEVISIKQLALRIAEKLKIEPIFGENDEMPVVIAPDNLLLENTLYKPIIEFNGSWRQEH